MNTLSILDAESSNIPEGLYLQLVNALKSDFVKSEKELNDKERLQLLFTGYTHGEAIVGPDFCLDFLKQYSNDKLLIKEIYDGYFSTQEDRYIYDNILDRIVSIHFCKECKQSIQESFFNKRTEVCFNCVSVYCCHCKTKIDDEEYLYHCLPCDRDVCYQCQCQGECPDCTIIEFTKCLKSYSTPYIPLLRFIPKTDDDNIIEIFVSMAFTKILNISFNI